MDTQIPLFRTEYPRNKVLFVKVYTNQKAVMTVVLAPTVSLIEMVSNFGGILGLFTGISILSLAEIAFWILKALVKKVTDLKTVQEKPEEIFKTV